MMAYECPKCKGPIRVEASESRSNYISLDRQGNMIPEKVSEDAPFLEHQRTFTFECEECRERFWDYALANMLPLQIRREIGWMAE